MDINKKAREMQAGSTLNKGDTDVYFKKELKKSVKKLKI